MSASMELQLEDIIICLVSMIIYTIAGATFLHYKIKIIHESGLSIIFGSLVAIFFHYILKQKKDLQFNQTFFFYFVLPPIIFSAGYNIQKAQFFSRIKYIMVFGVLGTIINFIVVVSLTVLLNNFQFLTVTYDRQFSENDGQIINFTLEEILLFSATVCASDSVAALTLIDKYQYPKIHSILLGEGIINDSVSIIIFKSVAVSSLQQNFDFQLENVLILIENFFYISICSLLLGILFGGIHAFILKKFRFLSKNALYQICLTFLFGLLTYLVCETLKLSGIISILTCSIMISHYSFHNMSMKAKKASGITLETLSHLAEGLLFFYLGISIFEKNSSFSILFIVIELIIILIARFISIFSLILIMNFKNWIFKQKMESLNIHELTIISFGGSVRGAVAYALILSIKNNETPNIRIIKNCVLFVVLISTVFLGGGMGKIQQCFLNQQISSSESENEIRIDKKIKQKKGNRYWRSLDENYLRPLFIYKSDDQENNILDENFLNEFIQIHSEPASSKGSKKKQNNNDNSISL